MRRKTFTRQGLIYLSHSNWVELLRNKFRFPNGSEFWVCVIAINKRTVFRLLVNHLPLPFCTQIILFVKPTLCLCSITRKFPKRNTMLPTHSALRGYVQHCLSILPSPVPCSLTCMLTGFLAPPHRGHSIFRSPGRLPFFGVAFKVKEAKEKPTSNPNA